MMPECQQRVLTIKTDGGSRGNPGRAGIGFVIIDTSLNDEIIYEGYAYLGVTTNNVAEYHALIWALKNARKLNPSAVNVYADSELMVKQLNKEYKVKNESLKPLATQAFALMSELKNVSLKHVYRSENKEADALANQAMDTRSCGGNFIVPFEEPQTQLTIGYESLSDPDNLLNQMTDRGDRDAQGSKMHHEAPLCSDRLGSYQFSGPECSNTTPQTCHCDDQDKDFHQIARRGARMFHLTIKSHFDAAHALVGYPGECRKLHGHTWDVECTIKGSKLDEVGILYDFKALKRDLNEILNRFDHEYMNDIPPFDQLNSTAENLSEYIFNELESKLPDHVTLESVAVWESPVAKTTFTRE